MHVGRVVVGAQGELVKDERLSSLVAAAQQLARAVEGQVAVSSLAARLVRAEFAMEDLASRDNGAPEGARVVSPRAPPPAAARFVGRHDELKRLGDILAAATRKRPQIVTLSGEEGIGKTRLAAEMERRLGKGNYNVGFCLATCPHNGLDVPYSGLTAMLQALCGIQEWDDDATILAVAPRLRALGLDDEEARAIVAQLGASLDSTEGDARRDHGTAVRTGFSRMVQSLAEERLQLFAWDDAHALDAASERAIAHAVERGRARGAGLRAVFLFATRTRPLESFVADEAHHAMALGELTDEDAARLVAVRLGARILPGDLLSLCRERAAGHPLFIEELLRDLGDTGAVTVMNGEVKTKLEGATAAPRTLRALIGGRVSRLDAEPRAAMQAAAILGDPVPLQVHAAMLRRSVPQVDGLVASLAANDFLRPSGPSWAVFASPMLGEIVLAAVLPEVRRELHASAAAAYIATLGDSEEHADRVAPHLHEAGERDRAATFFVRRGAGAAAARSDRPRHALARPRARPRRRRPPRAVRARELAQARRRRYEARPRRAAARRRPRARAAPHRRRRHGGGARDRPRRRRPRRERREPASSRRTSTSRRARRSPVIATICARAVSSSRSRRRHAAGRLQARALRAGARLEAAGPIDDALDARAHRPSAAQTQGDRELLALAADSIKPRASPTRCTSRPTARRSAGSCTRRCATSTARQRRSARASRSLARSLGLRFAVAIGLHNLGDSTRRIGDLPRAYASLTESKDLAELGGHERLAMLNRTHLAYLDGLSGSDAALATLRELMAYQESRRFLSDALESRFLLGSLLRRRGEASAARKELEDVLERAIDLGNKLIAEDAREELGELRA